MDTRTDSLGRFDRSTYDAAGNLATFTDRKGQVTNLTYDALNRLALITHHDGTAISYTWDAANRLTQVVDSVSGTISRTYDLLDRLIHETTPQGEVGYTYDSGSRRTSMTVGGQPAVGYSYDNASRLTQITQGAATVTFEYDAAGRRTRLTLPNGVATEYTYDAASRITGLTYKRSATILGTLAYAYDAAGKRMQASGSWARTVLPAAMASVTYNAASHQLSFDGQSLTFDLIGNLIAQGDTTYTWDARGRLVGVTGPGVIANFQYDGFGRRTQKTINGVTTAYLYDGATPVQERISDETVNLLTGPGIDEYLTRTDAGGRRAFLTDVLGSTIALTDDSGAVVVTEYTYSAFGATTFSGAASGNPFRYTGREYDGPTGLYYYRARYYSPTLHRFLSEDGLGIEPWNTNLYTYVSNDPLQFVDPEGASATTIPLRLPRSPHYCGVVDEGMQALGDLLMFFLLMIFAMMSGGDGSPAASAAGGGTPGAPPPADGPTPKEAGAGAGDPTASAGGTAGAPAADPTVGDVLKGKQAGIQRAPLPPGSPNWDDIRNDRMSDIVERANVPHPVSWTPEGDIDIARPSSIVDPEATVRSRFIGHAAISAARAATGV